MVNVEQLHNLKKNNAKMTGSLTKAMTKWFRCVIIPNIKNQ